ncbi:hypothetical protein GN958_ATG01727, partial [Phytophthora infestans]
CDSLCDDELTTLKQLFVSPYYAITGIHEHYRCRHADYVHLLQQLPNLVLEVSKAKRSTAFGFFLHVLDSMTFYIQNVLASTRMGFVSPVTHGAVNSEKRALIIDIHLKLPRDPFTARERISASRMDKTATGPKIAPTFTTLLPANILDALSEFQFQKGI